MPGRCSGMTNNGERRQKVLVWDLDETLIIFQTLTTGRFAYYFQGAKDSRLAIKLGRRWEKLIIQVCDGYFFYEQVEDFNEPNLEAWKQFDDGRDLSMYDFKSDGLSKARDFENNQKLAYRHRWISQMYTQGLETLLNEEQLQEWQELYELTDSYTDGWLTAGRTILQSCMEADGNDMGLSTTNMVHVLVTSGSLVPSLVKILLFKLDKFIPYEHVYSSTEVGKLKCFQWIRERFGTSSQTKFCAIGDGLDECDAAEVLKWPFIKVDPHPYGDVRLPALSVPMINNYISVVYGADEIEHVCEVPEV
ncbi:hypothetical protein KP509_24G065900 [Ceratopteris richardii]|uniref:protein-tyrosine-phosphatase n=1 Tax=Ceratopteris richardii TaxID=49495 RepID=A0A8T2RYH3_CERRI|nr:hypothetical protein KP509_24G065900 [Ceratopteris richardii]